MLAGVVLGLKATMTKMYANLDYSLWLTQSHFLPVDGR